MIDGVIITPKKQISDDRGKIIHMLRNDDKIFKKFGEIYFSCIYPNKIKAWHLHKSMTLNYSLIYGKIKLVLFDDRKKSKTYKNFQEIILSTENYSVVTVPPMIWNGFKCLSKETSILANCSDIPHDTKEIERKNFNDKYISYNWSEK